MKGPKAVLAASALTYRPNPSEMAAPNAGTALQTVKIKVPPVVKILRTSFKAATLSEKNCNPC